MVAKLRAALAAGPGMGMSVAMGIATMGMALAGCTTSRPPRLAYPADLGGDATTREVIGPPRPLAEQTIRPTDRLNVRVLFEPEMSSPDVRVDAGGLVSLPLVGEVKAAGLSTGELAGIVSAKLRTYLLKPEVTVSVLSTAGDHITVEGSVNEPGVYDIPGSAGLLEVLARARGPSKTASLSQVTVFRRIDGRRAAAVFNVGRIRRGLDEDPQLYPGDTVVVGFSFLKGAYRDFLTIAPGAISIFRFY